jgi:hypothetical protein
LLFVQLFDYGDLLLLPRSPRGRLDVLHPWLTVVGPTSFRNRPEIQLDLWDLPQWRAEIVFLFDRTDGVVPCLRSRKLAHALCGRSIDIFLFDALVLRRALDFEPAVATSQGVIMDGAIAAADNISTGFQYLLDRVELLWLILVSNCSLSQHRLRVDRERLHRTILVLDLEERFFGFALVGGSLFIRLDYMYMRVLGSERRGLVGKMEGAVAFSTLRLRIHEIRPSAAKLLRLPLAGELIELLQASSHAVRQLG